jgi:hypothetical protein
MCMTIMDTHICMEIRSAWMQEVISGVPLLIEVGGMRRGMLAAPGTGGT